MIMKDKFAVMTMLVVAGVAIAENVGTYTCADCLLGPLSGPDETLFIQTVVNNDVSNWVDSQGNPKTVTLCNGSKCATYEYVPATGVFKMIVSWPQAGGGGGGGGGATGGDGGSYSPPGNGIGSGGTGTVTVGRLRPV